MTIEYVTFDCETYPIQPGEPLPPVVCLSWARFKGGAKIDGGLLKPDEGAEWLRARLEGDDAIVGHNTPFDLGVMMRHDPTLLAPIFDALVDDRIYDTQIRAQLIKIQHGRPLHGVGLNVLAQEYGVGKDRSGMKKAKDSWRLRYNELAHLPFHRWPKEAVDYALADADETGYVWWAQFKSFIRGGIIAPRIKGEDRMPLNNTAHVWDEAAQLRAGVSLRLMSAWGMRTDPESVKALRASLEARAAELEEGLLDAGLLKVKKGEVKKDTQSIKWHIVQVACRAQGIDPAGYAWMSPACVKLLDMTKKKVTVTVLDMLPFPLPRTATGDLTIGQDILEAISDETIEALVEWDALKKKLGTFIPVLELGTIHPVTADYRTLVETGRTSCAKPNMQNLPRKGGERECFVARDGCVLIAVDYSTLELRAWAQRCENLGIHSRMAEVMREGKDVHRMFACYMLDIDYEDYAPALHSLHRGAAKPLNFGAPVGMGAQKLDDSARKSYGVDFREMGMSAEELLILWKEMWPEAPLYFDYISKQLRDTNEVVVKEKVMPDGTVKKIEYKRKKGDFYLRESGRPRGGCGFTDGANFGFQGLAADGAKAALWAVTQECYADPSSPLWGFRPVAFIHDEIIIEGPEDGKDAATDRLCAIMIEEMERYIHCVPILVDAAVMRRWYKGAESERVDGEWTVYSE